MIIIIIPVITDDTLSMFFSIQAYSVDINKHSECA